MPPVETVSAMIAWNMHTPVYIAALTKIFDRDFAAHKNDE